MTLRQRCESCGTNHTSLTACRLDIVKLARKYLRELSTGLRASVENPWIYVITITWAERLTSWNYWLVSREMSDPHATIPL
jgi:hypothetical protein